MENCAALPARYILGSDIKTCTPRSRALSEPQLVLTKRITETKQPNLRARAVLSNSRVHGDQIGGDNLEGPSQRGGAFFARLLHEGGVTTWVVVAECRRQGGSVSFSLTPRLFGPVQK